MKLGVLTRFEYTTRVQKQQEESALHPTWRRLPRDRFFCRVWRFPTRFGYVDEQISKRVSRSGARAPKSTRTLMK